MQLKFKTIHIKKQYSLSCGIAYPNVLNAKRLNNHLNLSEAETRYFLSRYLHEKNKSENIAHI